MWGSAPHPEVLRFCFQGGGIKRDDATSHRLPSKPMQPLRSLLSVALPSCMVKHFYFTFSLFCFAILKSHFVLDTGYTLNKFFAVKEMEEKSL